MPLLRSVRRLWRLAPRGPTCEKSGSRRTLAPSSKREEGEVSEHDPRKQSYIHTAGDSKKTGTPQVTVRFHGTEDEQRTACRDFVNWMTSLSPGKADDHD